MSRGLLDLDREERLSVDGLVCDILRGDELDLVPLSRMFVMDGSCKTDAERRQVPRELYRGTSMPLAGLHEWWLTPCHHHTHGRRA